MTVRITESRIPEGLLPEDLGEIGNIVEPPVLAEPDCFLISYLPSPLTIGSSNSYVVFVVDESLRQNIVSFKWQVFEEISEIDRHEVEVDSDLTKATFSHTVNNLAPLYVQISLLDVNDTELRILSIRQEVRPPFQSLELLLRSEDVTIDGEILDGRNPIGLHPDTSREVINELYPYIQFAFESVELANKVPFRLLAAIIYLQVFRVPKNDTGDHPIWAKHSSLFRQSELENMASLLSGESTWFVNEYDAIGVSQISPATAAMFLIDPEIVGPLVAGTSNTYIEQLALPSNSEDRDSVSQVIHDNYANLRIEQKADLFNWLRFPKSNIKLCYEILNQIKNRPIRFPVLTTEELFNNDEAIKLVGTEFEIGITESTLEQAKPNEFGGDILKIVGVPLFAIGFGGDIDIKIEGTVVDDSDNNISMEGAIINLYMPMLRVTTTTRKCFRSFENISPTTPENEFVALNENENLVVLEVIREPLEYPQADLVKVQKYSTNLNYNEGWVIVRWDNTYFAELLSIRVGSVATVDSNNEFSFVSHIIQPSFIRVVKEPDGNDNGYFDGQLMEEQEGLPLGWFLPPKSNLVIRMKPEKYMIRESDFTDLLDDWMGYTYAINWKPRYPNGYYIKNFGINEAANSQVACNTFVEAIVVQAWRTAFSANNDFEWSLPQHEIAMIQNEWIQTVVGVPGHWNNDIDIFGSANIQVEQLIIVTSNPDNDSDFTVTVDGTAVTVQAANRAGNSNAQRRTARRLTAANIAIALNGNATVSAKIHVIHGHTRNEYVAIRSVTDDSLEFPITVAGGNGAFTVTPLSPEIFPAVKVDVTDFTVPPPWLILQGWNSWNPVQNPTIIQGSNPAQLESPDRAVGFGGHNLFLVDVDPASKKILTLEANSAYRCNGPGFRSLQVKGVAAPAKSGNIDNNVVNGNVTPNKTHHWTEKVNWDWDRLKNNYAAQTDPPNPMGTTRLKLYDLQWTVPQLYETTFRRNV